MPLSLQKGLQASYLNPNEAKTYLTDDGYIYDDQLSTVNSKVYYNPQDKDLLIAYRGSKNIWNDWLTTDLAIPFGGIKSTDRYKESKVVYDQAKSKYNSSSPSVIGHSLGGSLASAVGGEDSNSKIYTYNKGAGLFGTDTNIKPQEKAYRQGNDLVSYFSSFNTHKPITLGHSFDPISAHNVNNLEKHSININK